MKNIPDSYIERQNAKLPDVFLVPEKKCPGVFSSPGCQYCDVCPHCPDDSDTRTADECTADILASLKRCRESINECRIIINA